MRINSVFRLWVFCPVLQLVPVTAIAATATPPHLSMLPKLAPAPTLAQATATVLYVSPAGNDAVANGSDRAPFKTLTAALRLAQPNTVIVLAPGRYSSETGEVFPLTLKAGVTVQGNALDRGQLTVISGSGRHLSPTAGPQEVTLVGAAQAAIVGVTLSNPSGIGLWIESSRLMVRDSTFRGNQRSAMVIAGNSAAQIQDNFFSQNPTQGLTIAGTATPEVRGNIFEQSGVAIAIDQAARPQIVGNRITQNQDGIVAQAQSQPRLRQNSVEGNQRDGLVVLAQSQPDLGSASDPGSNWVRNNGRYDLNTQAVTRTIATAGNDIPKVMGQVAGAPAPMPAAVPPASASIPVAPVKATPVNPRAPIALQPPQTQAGISAASFPVPAAILALPQPAPPMQVVKFIAPPPKRAPKMVPAPSPEPPARQPIAPPPSTRLAVVKPIATVTVLPPGVRPSLLPSRKPFPPIPPPPVRPKSPAQVKPPAVTVPVAAPVSQTSALFPTLPPPAGLPPQDAPRPVALPAPLPISRSPMAIPIPVPLPEARSGDPPPVPETSPRLARTNRKPDLLPVPGSDVPIGDVGESTDVNIYRRTQVQPEGLPTSPLLQSAVTSGRYRVVIEASDDRQQGQIPTIAPTAFRTFMNGRLVWQVGAFSDQDRAQDLVQSLARQGLIAKIEPME